VHSGDSSCALPPITLGDRHLAEIRQYTEALARGIGVRGLINVQYALKDDLLYVLEANPRASRTVPFVSKATAVPLAKAAARIMLGATIDELRAEGMLMPTGDGGELPEHAPISVKQAVLPFKRFRTPAGKGVDSLLGPEMKSTGEVMGIDFAFGLAFAKSQAAVYGSLPISGKIFVSVANRDKRGMIFPVKRLADLGFEIVATIGTGAVLRRHGIDCEIVRKHSEGHSEGRSVGQGRSAVELISSGDVCLVINTPQGSGANARLDGYEIRSAAVIADIPCITTVPGASAAVMGIEATIRGEISVRPIQELHKALRGDGAL
jgi:carbamoyl-phosphate synthase large subunit